MTAKSQNSRIEVPFATKLCNKHISMETYKHMRIENHGSNVFYAVHAEAI
jgi:hypothetical protein